MSIRYISMFDLLSNSEAKKIVEDEDSEAFLALLFDIGFDTSRDIEYQEVYSRSMIDHRVICYGRWVGFERTDKWWMQSEYCTFENTLLSYSVKDRWMMEELFVMSERSNFTGKLVQQLEETFGKSKEYEKADDEDAIFELIRTSNKHKDSLKDNK